MPNLVDYSQDDLSRELSSFYEFRSQKLENDVFSNGIGISVKYKEIDDWLNQVNPSASISIMGQLLAYFQYLLKVFGIENWNFLLFKTSDLEKTNIEK